MSKNVTRWFTSAGGLLAVLAPKGLCPVCVAASGGLLSSLGLGFLAVERNVRWMLAGTLAIGLVGLALSARRHRRWWTLAIAAGGAASALTGRFLLFDALLYGGMVLLSGALLADLWARKHPRTAAADLVQIGVNRNGGCGRCER